MAADLMISSRHAPRTLPAWLGLFAMLLVFMGPLISQSQRAADHAQTAEHSMAAGHDMSQDGETHAHLAACGYCLLFAHVPALSLPALQLPVGSRQISTPLMTACQAPRAPPFLHATFAPRAPPSFLSTRIT
ncbi:DUF2946 domain-containing protein [Larsenimonas rhizosphaerae]|uniref:DUF2946 domain-containing protein n=1 Tax=Larsenimonas rhizosphaerae TaxID=2944682 RepID=A0AA42CUU8_9GAMM|nr:DUF2946 domain-containing protein [Larsenimonas rhizosphaerae]MCM2131915.1 DUF2946 domain-containing protein [Larsenimonas rhizosphaerae]MCX2524779.1 DUF2946 domain-containing protein [Larsenimonas rhizosphaerae]